MGHTKFSQRFSLVQMSSWCSMGHKSVNRSFWGQLALESFHRGSVGFKRVNRSLLGANLRLKLGHKKFKKGSMGHKSLLQRLTGHTRVNRDLLGPTETQKVHKGSFGAHLILPAHKEVQRGSLMLTALTKRL